MLLRKLFIFIFFTFSISTCWAEANPHFKPIIIYQGSVVPGSYQHLLERGVLKFEQVSAQNVERVRIERDLSLYLEELDRAAQQGYNPIIVQDSNVISRFDIIAAKYPATKFISMDVSYDIPNVLGITFDHAKGAYIIGFLAGLKTKTDRVGFLGGMDIPVINEFQCGYRVGLKDANPNAELTTRYINTGTLSWEDSETASKLAEEMFDQGVDIVFPAAGFASIAVIEAAQGRNLQAFGVDNDLSEHYPDTVQASLVKRSDSAIFAALMQIKNQVWNYNNKVFGMKQNVITIKINSLNSTLSKAEISVIKQLINKMKGEDTVLYQKLNRYCAV
jgi:basic membrane protein A